MFGTGDTSNDGYIRIAANGSTRRPGVAKQIVGLGALAGVGALDGIDTVSGATCSSKAIIEACRTALEAAKKEGNQ